MDANPIIDLSHKRHADELRATWQTRLLMACGSVDTNGILRPRDTMGACILSVMAHNFDDALPVILRIAFPSFTAIGTPMLCSAARIARSGHVMADFISTSGFKRKNQAFFKNTRDMERQFRKVADKARLDDNERIEMFDAVKRWVVCDYRLDPTMDRNDPDAKRLTVN